MQFFRGFHIGKQLCPLAAHVLSRLVSFGDGILNNRVHKCGPDGTAQCLCGALWLQPHLFVDQLLRGAPHLLLCPSGGVTFIHSGQPILFFFNFYFLTLESKGRKTLICCSTYLCIHRLILVRVLTGNQTCSLEGLG